MTTYAILVQFTAAILFGQTAPEVAGQPAQKDAQKEAIKKEGPTGDRRERGARRDRIANASPEGQQRFQVDRLVDRATRTYELSDDQKVTVRHEIEKMERERREAMGLEAAEYDKLQERMLKLRRPIREAAEGPVDRDARREQQRRMMQDPEVRKLRQRLMELEQKHRIDWDDASHRIESLLPAEQAQKGRQRIEEQSLKRDERQQRWRQRLDDRSNQTGAPPVTEQPVNGSDKVSSESAAPAIAEVAGKPAAPAPVHPWEAYVRSFIAEHDLSPSQQASAMAVLKDVRSRAGQIEISLRERIAAADKIPDEAARSKRLTELHEPVERLFVELKTRLDGLLTAAQRTPSPAR